MDPKEKKATPKQQEATKGNPLPTWGMVGKTAKAIKDREKMLQGLNCGGKVEKMKAGGKVRGSGCCKKGVRKAKMC